jgi:hypothetical protein
MRFASLAVIFNLLFSTLLVGSDAKKIQNSITKFHLQAGNFEQNDEKLLLQKDDEHFWSRFLEDTGSFGTPSPSPSQPDEVGCIVEVSKSFHWLTMIAYANQMLIVCVRS